MPASAPTRSSPWIRNAVFGFDNLILAPFAAAVNNAAKGAKIKLSKPKTAFLIDGDDRVGALAGILARLGAAKINVTAVTGGGGGVGGDGAPLLGEQGAVEKNAAALGGIVKEKKGQEGKRRE